MRAWAPPGPARVRVGAWGPVRSVADTRAPASRLSKRERRERSSRDIARPRRARGAGGRGAAPRTRGDWTRDDSEVGSRRHWSVADELGATAVTVRLGTHSQGARGTHFTSLVCRVASSATRDVADWPVPTAGACGIRGSSVTLTEWSHMI